MSTLRLSNLPRHIAIIMDGNGRWAKKKGLSRIKGHQAGVESVREIVTESARLGIKRLTLYAFSRENWKRPQYEINYLMKQLRKYLIQERPEIMKNNVRFTALGRLAELPQTVQRAVQETIKLSQANTGLILCLALNYGGRTELVDAVQKIVRAIKGNSSSPGGFKPEEITEETIQKYLYDPTMEDPDLLIRTAGEMRISNFLLWQISYTELWITPTLWPDFRKEHLHQAISDYAQRQRKFGGLP